MYVCVYVCMYLCRFVCHYICMYEFSIPLPTVRFWGIARTVVYDITPRDVMYFKLSLER